MVWREREPGKSARRGLDADEAGLGLTGRLGTVVAWQERGMAGRRRDGTAWYGTTRRDGRARVGRAWLVGVGMVCERVGMGRRLGMGREQAWGVGTVWTGRARTWVGLSARRGRGMVRGSRRRRGTARRGRGSRHITDGRKPHLTTTRKVGLRHLPTCFLPTCLRFLYHCNHLVKGTVFAVVCHLIFSHDTNSP